MAYLARPIVGIKLTGWNVFAVRFVDAPSWTWEPVPNASYYEVRLAGPNDKKATTYRVDEPSFDLSALWNDLPVGTIDMLLLGFDAEGTEICHSAYKHFSKVADFDGQEQAPLNWAESVRHNMAYLLAPARDRIEDYEKGLPRCIWSSMEDSVTGQRFSNTGCVGQYFPAWINGLMLFAEQYPSDPLADEARAQSQTYGDWLLENRLPEEGACRGLPFSIVMNGELKEMPWGNTLCYSGRVGMAMIDLYAKFGDAKYLQYARHLADILIDFQRDDGSWPFRVDPQDGSVKPENEYTSNAVEPAMLYARLDEIEAHEPYRTAHFKAITWVLQNPIQTNRWEQVYCDGPASPTWENLENWDVLQMIRYLVHYRGQSPDYIEIAERLNRFVEDQFVVWRPEDYPTRIQSGSGGMGLSGPTVNLQTLTPMVMEQYGCYYPMESHTGNWTLALIALHEATQNREYLNKAICAGNAIVRGQQESGAFATWGFDTRFGRPLDGFNWPPDNVCGAIGLMHLDQYCRSLEADEPCKIGLRGI